MSLLSVENLPETETVAVVTEHTMEERLSWCNELNRQAVEALHRSWQIGVVLGWELTRIKENMQHGYFGKLFGDVPNCEHVHNFNFTQNMANRYMRLYDKCVSKAELLNMEDELFTMLEEYSGSHAPEAAERLTLTFNKIAPEATSMRQALLEFMRTEPEFSKRNDKGQIKTLTDAAAQVKAATLELEGHVRKLDELLESGRYTLADSSVRADMEAVCRAFAQKLSLVR